MFDISVIPGFVPLCLCVHIEALEVMKAELAHRLNSNDKAKDKNNTSLHLSAVESFLADGLRGLS